jgi:hypothetical protein
MAILAYGAHQAKAVTSDTAFGSCTGAAAGNDCTAALGHISASVVGTLSINEMRAISFGNFAVPTSGNADDSIVLDPTGVRTVDNTGTDQIVLLSGADGCNGGPCGGGGGTATETGSQSPGHYTVSASVESAATTQVYISFADATGNPIDACSPGGEVGGPHVGGYTGVPDPNGGCDNYHPGNFVQLTGPTANAFTVDQFQFNESGSDVYGHYIDNLAAVGPGIGNPFLPGTGSGTGHDNGTGAPGNANATQAIDVVVGATLHTTAVPAVLPGKYTGTFIIMVSY